MCQSTSGQSRTPFLRCSPLMACVATRFLIQLDRPFQPVRKESIIRLVFPGSRSASVMGFFSRVSARHFQNLRFFT